MKCLSSTATGRSSWTDLKSVLREPGDGGNSSGQLGRNVILTGIKKARYERAPTAFAFVTSTDEKFS